MKTTTALAAYVKKKGITISSIAEKTGISVNILYRSLSDLTRALRFDEALAICVCLEVDPMMFWESEEE